MVLFCDRNDYFQEVYCRNLHRNNSDSNKAA